MENRTFIIVPIGAILMIIFTVFMYFYTSNKEETTYINFSEDYTKSENPEIRKLALRLSHLGYCRHLCNNDIEQIQRFEKKFPDVEYIDYCKKNKHSNSNDSEKFYKKFNY